MLRHWRFALLGILTLLLSILCAEISLYSTNILENHRAWISGKSLVAMGVMGSGEVRKTRNLLAQNQLNLESWYGYQEVLSAKPQLVAKLEGRYRVGDNSYLDLIFFRDHASQKGFRISRSSRLKSLAFVADPGGTFTWKQGFELPNLENRWYPFSIERDSNWVKLFVEGVEIASLVDESPKPGLIGFRGARGVSRIDDIRLYATDNELVLQETFRRSQHFVPLSMLFAGLFASILLALYVLSWLSGRDLRFRYLMIGFISLFGLLSTYFLFDYTDYSHRYPFSEFESWKTEDRSVELRLEERRQGFAQLVEKILKRLGPLSEADPYQSVKEFLRDRPADPAIQRNSTVQIIRNDHGVREYLAPKFTEIQLKEYLELSPIAPGTLPVLLLGSSQFRGAGAGRHDEVMVTRIFERVTSRIQGSHTVALFNLSVDASTASRQFDRYRYVSELVGRPHALVVNLGCNDADNKHFKEWYRKILEQHHRFGGPTVLSLEAVDQPTYQSIAVRHAETRELAAEFNAQVVESHATMHSEEVLQSGVTWLDRVHMTSHGQKVVAELIGDALAELLRAQHHDRPR